MSELSEIHAALREIVETQGHIKGTVDAMSDTVKSAVARIEGHDGRIRLLEDHKQGTAAVTAARGALSRFAAPIIAGIAGALTGVFASARMLH